MLYSLMFKNAIKKITLSLCLTPFLLMSALSYGESPYSWQAFNIPPWGSNNNSGIGFKLIEAYNQAGLEGEVIVTNAARWQVNMTNPLNRDFCACGSWKLPNTEHRVYSNSIINTVDYGVAVRPELYEKLSKGGQRRIVDMLDVINSTKEDGRLLIMKARPVFGEMGKVILSNDAKEDINIGYMTASEGPISMLTMASIKNRQVGSVLIFPEEFTNFTRTHPQYSLNYLMLSEGSNFAPIRASCPNTEEGRKIISKINQLLDDGLRDRAFQWFLDELPNIPEIRKQARINQECIKDRSCKDPLTP